jgi:peptidoglycan/xylan/chitin deacetylase (PgdA/CDA1 family)
MGFLVGLEKPRLGVDMSLCNTIELQNDVQAGSASMKHDMSVAWPNGARCAVMITYDFDAETLWTSRDDRNWKRPGVLSQGRYGAKVGVPKILEMLAETETPATFFVPGWTVENHTDRVEMILKAGHEVGHHSYSHKWVSEDPAAEAEEFEKGLDALKRCVGVTPKGFRSPAGEVSDGLLATQTRHGLLYDTSLMDDVTPIATCSRTAPRGR